MLIVLIEIYFPFLSYETEKQHLFTGVVRGTEVFSKSFLSFLLLDDPADPEVHKHKLLQRWREHDVIGLDVAVYDMK